MELRRREFITTSVAAALLAGVPAGWRGSAYAPDAPNTPKGRLGFMPLLGGLDPDLAWESLHLFEHEVLPKLGP